MMPYRAITNAVSCPGSTSTKKLRARGTLKITTRAMNIAPTTAPL